MSGFARLIGSMLSWLHQAAFPICPGSWPWTVTMAGALLALFPVLGAVLVALIRKATGNSYSAGVVVTFGSFGLILGFVLPWLIADTIGQIFSNNGGHYGLSGTDIASLGQNACFFQRLGTQGQYLGTGNTAYEALMRSNETTVMFSLHVVTLVGVPLLCLLAIMLQQRMALRGGPGWPSRLMWIPFVLFVLGTLPLDANLMAQLWLGFLPASLVGILVVALFGRPSWSVLNRQRNRQQPPPRQEPYRPAPPPPSPPVQQRPLAPTRVAPMAGQASEPPPAALANTPGPLPFMAGPPPSPRWNSADGRFRRVRQLGHGGFGTVWLAMDTQLDRTVALKLAHAPDGETQQRMLREARALAAVHHPNCVRVYDIVEDVDGLGIVMEYIDGRPLSDVVGDGPLDDVAAGRLWSTMAGALSDAHAKGVLHRDVKPANVLVDGNGIAHLIDFGIARTKGDATLTAAGMMMGTPDFLAPETASTGIATPASDAWQLAATVSYALTGQPPRGQRSNPMSALMAAAQRLPNTHLPERSRHIRLLRAALDADPSRRPTLSTVRRELSGWLAGTGHDEDGPVTAIVDTRGGGLGTRRL